MAVLLLLLLACSCWRGQKNATPVKIGIAWRSSFTAEAQANFISIIEEAGGVPVFLGQVRSDDLIYNGTEIATMCLDSNGVLLPDFAQVVKSGYANSNAEAVLEDIDAVIFTGGEDVCPTLYALPQDWHGVIAERDFNATRDVSEYLLMDCCIQKDLPVLAICRGMQLLAIYSGGTMIQDIPSYFAAQNKEYLFEHRNKKIADEPRDYAAHNVTVCDTSSLIYNIVHTCQLENVPSWHHQAVKSVDGTPLKVTAYTPTCSEPLIEVVERTDKRFVLGVQYHPEVAILKQNTKASNKDNYMKKAAAMLYFEALVEAAGKHNPELHLF